MSDEVPTGDKAVFAFLEMVALAFAFGGVNALLSGLPWLICTGSLLSSIVFFVVGIKWSSIKALIGRRYALWSKLTEEERKLLGLE